jgi:hypothetical protein
MSTATNNIAREVSRKSVFMSALKLISSSISFKQGDFLYLDTTNHLIKPVTPSDAQGDTFLGVAPVTIESGKLKSPYTTDVDSSAAIGDIPGPVYGVIINVSLKSGDAFVPGGAVYISGLQEVTSSSNTGARKAIGYFQDAAITAGATSTGNVLIGTQITGALTF